MYNHINTRVIPCMNFHSLVVPRPFRLLHPQSLNQTWKPVSSLERSQTYIQGNVRDFIRMTGWSGYRVLYFGDNVFSDLAVSLIHTSIYYALWSYTHVHVYTYMYMYMYMYVCIYLYTRNLSCNLAGKLVPLSLSLK